MKKCSAIWIGTIDNVLSSLFPFPRFSFFFQFSMRGHQSIRSFFSPKDDARLKKLVEKYGNNNWTLIANKIKKFSPRQCKDRYEVYLLKPTIKRPWTMEEDLLIQSLFATHGTKWGLISNFFNARNANDIKNRYYRHVRHMDSTSGSKLDATRRSDDSNDSDKSTFQKVSTENELPYAKVLDEQEIPIAGDNEFDLLFPDFQDFNQSVEAFFEFI